VIRDDDDLRRISEYVLGNPACWNDDENNPLRLACSDDRRSKNQ
jgi:hypothetical protein